MNDERGVESDSIDAWGSSRPLLEVRGLTVRFPIREGWFGRTRWLTAVETASFRVDAGETVALVGESGSGKTSLGRALLRLAPASAGEIWLHGEPGSGPVDLARLAEDEFRPFRRHIQMVFQDPVSSLDPRLRVGEIVGEPLDIHRWPATRAAREARVIDLLREVGLEAEAISRYPHQFSGGQRQRIGIARALALEPRLVIADEPVSALDVSVRAQVINLMTDLRRTLGLSYLFISHDLALVASIADRILVMYLGQIVEEATARELFADPRHPYTRYLLASAPRPELDATAPVGARTGRPRPSGEPPSPIERPPGCPFVTRCPLRLERCLRERPVRSEIAPRHDVACFRAHEIDRLAALIPLPESAR